MNTKSVIARNVALVVVFAAAGLTMFTENVRPVQVLGLFASGAVVGAALTMIVQAFRSNRNKA